MTRGPLPDRVKQAALRLLALKDRSEEEVRKKLTAKGYESNLIEGLLAKFREQGYIDDEAYVDRRVRYLAREKLYGNRRIEVQLLEKGLSRERIRQVIDTVRQEFSEAEALKMRLAKKPPGKRINTDAGDKRRLVQHLLGKGFPPELIFETLDNMLEEHIHDDDGN
jgi:regulatory protein